MQQNIDLSFSEEQAMMLETAEAFCRDRSPIEVVRKQLIEKSPDGSLWDDLTDMGWLGLTIPEEYGGVGLGMAEAVCLMEPMGRALLTTPFMNTILFSGALMEAGTAAQKETYLPQICTGKAGSLALTEGNADWNLQNVSCRAERDGHHLTLSGTKILVMDADFSDFLLVSVLLEGTPSLVIVERSTIPDGSLQREVILDETRRSYRLILDGIKVPTDHLLDPLKTVGCLDYLDQAGCLLYAAEMCGGMAAAIDLTVEYLNTRQQFGRFIGAYQGLKHPMADILVQYEGARSLLYHAATVFNDIEAREVAVRMAKAYISDGFAYAGDRAVQFHGAMGFTYECNAQLYLRRALWGQSQYGDAAWQRQRLESILLDEN